MSCLIEPAVSAMVNPIVSFLWDPLVRQFDYLFKVGSNTRNLKKVSNKLRHTKDMVEVVEPSKQVSEWMDQVRTIEEQVTKINVDYDHRKICLCGCPINCWSSYRIGKRAAKTSLKVNELISEVKEFDLTRRRVPLAPEMINIPISTPSTAECVNKVSEHLLVDDVDIVGIWGMGGVGKTTHLKGINNHLSAKNIEFYVIWVVASKEADLHRLQSDIAKRVHLTLDETTSLDTRAQSLSESLKTKRCIVLIDDIWESLDVKMLGVSYPKHKVVFTTRSMEVCNDMTANRQEIKLRCMKIKIDCLKRDEGWQLFLQSVGEEVKTVIESDRRIRSYAEKVADKCGGLPLALVVIAKTMTAKTTWREWKDVADSIKRIDWSKTIIPFPVLKVSYDRLPSDSEKNCFLRFALWPEDYEIEENELIFCWLGMNLIDKCDDDIGSAYNKGHSIIQYLKRVCLLEEGKGASHGGVCTVKMHDIIREMALWILSSCEESNKSFLVLNEAQLERISECSTKWREAKAISLFKGRLDALPEHVPDCPNLSITIIQETNFLRGIPRSFFQNMHALTYLDLSSNRFSEFPQAICSLLQLQFLNLSENISNIGFSLPSELSNLKELRYIFLRHTAVRSIPHKLILSLEKLEILDMFHANYYRWGKDDEASIHEVLECSSARVLGIDIRAINTLERLSNNAHISIWWLNVYDLYRVTTLSLSESLFRTSNMRGTLRALTIEDCENLEEIDANSIYDEGCESLEHLKLYKLNNLRKLSLARKLLLENIRNLVIDGCKKLKNVTWVMKLRHLETLEVSYCDSMEQVIGDREDGDEGNDEDGLSNLKRLQLCHLPLLSCFKTHTDVLPTSLKFVDIFGCPKLDKTPFAHISNDR